MATQSPISLTILRRGETNIIDLAEVGALIPRSETRVDDTFLQELAQEMQLLATLEQGQRSRSSGQTSLAASVPPKVSRDLQRLGSLIFSHLLTEPARTRLRTAAPCALHLRLDEQLLAVPWELAYDGHDFLATKFGVGRQVITSQPLPRGESTRPGEGPVKVLLIADPTESLPQANREVEQLCRLLADVAGLNVTLMGGKLVRKLPLLAAVQEYDVVHFAGHSFYDPTAPQQSGWQLHEGVLSAVELSKVSRPPRLVFSNSCQAGATAAWHKEQGYRYEGQAFGIGSAFLLAGVQNYVGTFWVVHDEESVGFALAFYQNLATGLTLGGALQQARQAIIKRHDGHGLTWASYLLYGDPTAVLLPVHTEQLYPGPTPATSDSGVQLGEHDAATEVDFPERDHAQVEEQGKAPGAAMSRPGMQRKLAAIFNADVAGYSRLMGDDEEATIRTLAAYHGVMRSLIQPHRGRVVDSPGDNMLAEFASVVDAVRCAVEIQQTLRAKNAQLSAPRRMEFRIGINLGDVVVEGEKLYGDGVNIAARLEALAEPSGICISGTVYDQVENKLALGYEYIGEQVVKNIAKPVRVYRVQEAPSAFEAPVGEKKRTTALRDRRWAAWAAAALFLIGIGLVAIQNVPSWLFRTGMVQPAGQSLPLPDKPSIAVLPFVNMSEDPQQEYFSDGMTETLITDLSKLADLFVIARNSTFAYKGKAIKPQQVSQELGVRYMLEGSVQKMEARVRINMQLVDAATGRHLWAERYDRELKDIFALQDDITQKIVVALRVQFHPEEQAWLRRAPTANLEAYDYFLRGMASFWTNTKEANTQARQLFEKAIELDPQYAAAYAALSLTQLMDWLYWDAFRFPLQQILSLAQRAVELDAALPLARSILSTVYLWQKQHDHALVEAERALAVDPNFADGYLALANILTCVGKPEEAIRAMEQALRLNPTPPAQYFLVLGNAYHWASRYEEAITTLRKALAHNPNLFEVYTLLALSYSESDRLEDARAAVAELRIRQPYAALEGVQLRAPYKDPALVARMVEVLHKAGMKWRWPTDNLEALGSVWAGIEAAEKGWIEGNMKEGNTQARQFFERAIALDPQYAAAYAHLGRIYLAEWIWQWSQAPQTLGQAVALSQKAISLNDSLPWLYGYLAGAYTWQKQYEQARVVAERALALDPKDADGYVTLAGVQNAVGQPEKAVGLILKAMAMNPSAADWYRGDLGFAYYLMGRYKEAAAAFQRVLIHAPNDFFARLDLAATLVELGREEQAQAEATKVLQLEPTFSLAVARQRWPWKDQAGLERFVAALRKAGLK